jgi:hypothetical protein
MKNRRRRRLSDFKPNLVSRSGIAWFDTPESYARILEIMNYPEGMTRSYERWREVTEDRERFLKRGRRFTPIRVVIDPEQFATWCKARAVEPNRSSLYLFVEFATGRMRDKTGG